MRQDGNNHTTRKWLSHPLSRVTLVAFILLMLASSFFAQHLFSARAASFSLISLNGSISPQITDAQFIGSHTSSAPVTIGVMLSPNNQSKMDTLLSQMYDSHSPLYHHWLHKGAFDATFGSTLQQQAEVKNFLTGAGLQIVSMPGSLLIVAKGTIIQMEQAFHTTINDYRRIDGSTFFANSTAIQIPETLQGIVEGVTGLSDASSNEPLLLQQKRSRASYQYGGGPAGGLTPTQIAGIYDASPIYTILGKGVTVGLMEFSGFTPGDTIAYESQFGLTAVPEQYIMVDNGPTDHKGAGEVALDVEMIAALASSIDRIQIYEAPNSDLGSTLGYYQIAQDDTANSISTSWYSCEAMTSSSVTISESQSFKIMALQGQSMFASSGDNGAFDCLGANTTKKALQVDDPASQPYVTAVGGTSLIKADPGTTPNPTYPTGKETSWNNNCTPTTCYIPNGGGGGGNSTVWKQPSYQTGPGVSEGKYSKSGTWCKQATGIMCREVPDVSLNADPNSGYAVYCTDTSSKGCLSSGWAELGGTSASAPLWAAIVALTDSYLFAHGKAALGFANPYLYQLNATTGYSNVFHDIGKGMGNNGYYPTGTAYDMATGMGSVDIYRFVIQSLYPPFQQSVFVGADDHSLYALSTSSGTQLWHYVTGNTPSTPVVVGGTVYISSDELYALNASNGSLLWRYPFGNINGNSTPVIVNGVVYVGSGDGYMYAINATTGSLVWRYQVAGGNVPTQPVVSSGTIYFSAGTSSSGWNLYALNTSDGTLLWQQSVFGLASLAVSNGIIYASTGSYMEALNATSGSTLWEQAEGDELGTPTVVNGTIYVASSGLYGRSGSVRAINADNGAQLWSYSDTNTSFVFDPFVLNGVVYTDFEDGVYTLNAADGTLLWSYPVSTYTSESPTVNNNNVYFSSSDGYIHVLSASNGSQVGQYLVSANANVHLTSPTVAP